MGGVEGKQPGTFGQVLLAGYLCELVGKLEILTESE
jgi:hypothetical protein